MSAAKPLTYDLLLITMADQFYSLPLEAAGHIIELDRRDLVPVPGTPPAVLGLTCKMGRIVTVLDLAALLSLPPQEYPNPAVLLILNEPYRHLGLMVGEVHHILTSSGSANIEKDEASVQPADPWENAEAIALAELLNDLADDIKHKGVS